MPLYEFKCTRTPACRTFEKRFKSLADYEAHHELGLNHCPVCGDNVSREPSRTAPPVFNGSGFYQTDYKK